jgi:hypothetical protein
MLKLANITDFRHSSTDRLIISHISERVKKLHAFCKTFIFHSIPRRAGNGVIRDESTEIYLS